MRVHENDTYQKLIDELQILTQAMEDEEAICNKIAEIESIAQQENDDILRVIAIYHKGDIPYRKGGFEECRSYLQRALNLCKEIDFQFYMLRCYNSIAIIDSEKADYYGSIGNYIRAFHIADAHPEFQYGCILLNNIGNLFVWLNEHEKAIEYLLLSHEKYQEEKISDDIIISTIILNIIEEYSLLKNFDKANEWAQVEIPYIYEIDEFKKLILKVNEIELHYKACDNQRAAKLVDEILDEMQIEDNFIENFRNYMRLLEYSIQAKDKVTASRLLQTMEQLHKDAAISTFEFDYIQLKYQYYEVFNEKEDPDTETKRLLKEYTKGSRAIVEQLRNTYTRRLIVETELMKVTAEKEDALDQSRRLQKDVELDYFTKTFNKMSIEKHITEAIGKRVPHTTQAIALIDIDHFKDVNDTYGHDRGDELILEVVEMIASSCSKDMLLGRFGGDEFILFLKNVRHHNFITTIAEELLEKARQIVIADGKVITLSIGIYILRQDDDFKTAFLKADQALYQAKDNGRNTYSVVDGYKQ